MVLLLIIPFSWKSEGFCLKYLKLSVAGIKILLEIQSRSQSYPLLIDPACLAGEVKMYVY